MKTVKQIKNTCKVYIAGALNADAPGYIKNLARMTKYSIMVERMGAFTHNPGLDILQGLVHGDMSYEQYVENNIKALLDCHVMFICPESEDSVGVKKEI